jgi:hypothetical protein
MIGYVDLNRPIMSPLPDSVTNGNNEMVEPRYPIIDPRAKLKLKEDANSGPDPGLVDASISRRPISQTRTSKRRRESLFNTCRCR